MLNQADIQLESKEVNDCSCTNDKFTERIVLLKDLKINFVGRSKFINGALDHG